MTNTAGFKRMQARNQQHLIRKIKRITSSEFYNLIVNGEVIVDSDSPLEAVDHGGRTIKLDFHPASRDQRKQLLEEHGLTEETLKGYLKE